MLRLKIDGSEVLYVSIDEARETAAEPGRGIEFWRETLLACVQDEGAWNDLLDDLRQSGGEREAESLASMLRESGREPRLFELMCILDPQMFCGVAQKAAKRMSQSVQYALNNVLKGLEEFGVKKTGGGFLRKMIFSERMNDNAIQSKVQGDREGRQHARERALRTHSGAAAADLRRFW